jgi:transposase
LMTIPGVGPVTASAIVATIQDASAFASGVSSLPSSA